MSWLAARIGSNHLSLGWPVTEDAPVVAGTGLGVWYNRDREVHGLSGGGYWFEPYSVTYPTGRWRSGIDYLAEAKVAGSLTSYGLKWQGGFVRLLQCPGYVGDVFLHLSAATTGALVMKAAKIFRCQGEGMSLDSAGVAHSGDTLDISQASSSRGTGTTDTYGYAQTGTAYGYGAGASVVESIGTRNATYTPRARKRLHFRAKPGSTVSMKSIDTAGNGRTVIAYEVGAGIRLAFMADMTGATWTEVDIGLTGTQPAIRYLDSDAGLRLCLLYVTGGAVKMVTTDNEGGSLSVPTTIFATATHPGVDAYPGGWLLVASYAGGAISGKWVDRDGNVINGPFTIVASGADNDGIGVSYDPAASRWYVVYTASGAIATKYSDDGETWT
jgi:hypothetical protein